MRPEIAAPAFDALLQFLATKDRYQQRASMPSDALIAAARAAHNEFRMPRRIDEPTHHVDPLAHGCVEILELLAASSQNAARPPELITARGFRVRLDFRESTDTEPSSICVLVQCPEKWVACVQGQTAYLWNGAARFELGEFDADGKALGTLPAGIEITLGDFATGRVTLETPGIREHE